MYDFSFYKGKKVFVTGHTGFKGSYLTKMLLMFGADVYGYSLLPETTPDLFSILELEKQMGEKSHIGDIRNFTELYDFMSAVQPEIVFHLAAQPIVRTSYEKPVETYETNVMGTVHLLECVRKISSVRSVLIVTTDKVYENLEMDIAYVETDRLNGYDPYSNSKSCAELIVSSYKKSFLNGLSVPVSTMRAGNVLGGGDYARDRLLPDAVRAAKAGKPLEVRNPRSVRPFQFVLEPLCAYLMVAMKQEERPDLAGSYNIGPADSDILSAGHVADLFCETWGGSVTWEHPETSGPHEAGLLKLNSILLQGTYQWKAVYDLKKTIACLVAFEKAEDKIKEAEKQIREFIGASGIYKM